MDPGWPSLLAGALSIMVLLEPAVARADPAAAQQLFSDAKALMAQGKYRDACPKLEESQRLDAGLGTQFQLADCSAHIGKTATAWALFLEVAASAKANGQDSRAALARQRAAALEPRLARLEVSAVGTLPAGAEVKRDDVLIGRAQLGTAVPVDPGVHRVTASAPGRKPWSTQIEIAPDARITKHVVVPVLADAETPPPHVADASASTLAAAGPSRVPVSAGVPPSAAPGPEVLAETDRRQEDGSYPGDTQRTLGLVAGGLGVVGLATGAFFGLRSQSLGDDAAPYCTGNACTAEGVRLRDDAIGAGNVSTGMFVAGAALAASGTIVYFTAPRRLPGSAVRFIPHPAGIAALGSF